MVLDVQTLENEIDILNQQIVSSSEKEQQLENENELLREQIRLLQAKLFGRKSEKVLSSNGVVQLPLFEFTAPQEEDEEAAQEIKIEGHTRKKRGRKPLPDHLPRIEVIHDVSEEEKVCECGCQKDCIGEKKAEQFDIIPSKMQVIVHIRPQYACKACEGVEDDGPSVVIAPPPAQVIPKSIASAGLLAYTFTAKFVDGLPFYRQQKRFSRLGVEISRSTMCGWSMKTAAYCKPLIELLRSEILSGPLIGIDETTTLVMNEPGRKNTTKSYMWIFRGGSSEHPVLLFQYHPSREGNVAAGFLRGYKGYVQTDGYSGYDFLDHLINITHIGCWAHARRKYMDVVKARQVRKGKKKKKVGIADKALGYIRVLYQVERRIKNEKLKQEQISILHKEHSRQILEEFKEWLDAQVHNIPPKSILGKAVKYTLNQWHRLIGYIEEPFLTPDNNMVENAIRPYVIGRKNWLINGAPKGAEASAIFYSLIETAKANGLEPYHYLRFLLEKLPLAQSQDDYKALLPQYLDKSQLLHST